MESVMEYGMFYCGIGIYEYIHSEECECKNGSDCKGNTNTEIYKVEGMKTFFMT